MYKAILVFALLGFFSGQAAAASYGMAGCGLGSIVAKEMNWGDDTMQVLAATTNGTAGSQTFGITFGTSNCGESAVDRRRSEQEVFLKYNFADVKKDAARGEGKYLEAFAQLMGCGEGSQFSDFKLYSQSQFDNLYGNSDPQNALTLYHQAIRSQALPCAS